MWAAKKQSSAAPAPQQQQQQKQKQEQEQLNDENRDINRAAEKPVSCNKVQKAPQAAAVILPTEAEPAAPEIEYVASADLKPLSDPEAEVKTLVARLGSSDWVRACEALNHVRQISAYQPELLVPMLDNVMGLVLKAVKNPRSALCKTAIMACSDLFQAYQDQILEVFDPLLLQLLLKASQDKKFVCEEAERALVGMTTWISPVPLLHKLRPYTTHRNPRVRSKSAMCISKSVARLGAEGIKDYGVEALMQIASAQLIDQLPEAREAARKLVVELHSAYEREPSSGSDSWEQFCSSVLTPAGAQSFLRVCSTR